MIQLPLAPMAPITSDILPVGDEWGYQLKWDGVRLLSKISEGKVELYSRKLLPKNDVYPEVVRQLSSVSGQLLLDGEAVVFDQVKQRPVFQKVLQRERSSVATAMQSAGRHEPVIYVLFDLLHEGGADLRALPYQERYARLKSLFPTPSAGLFVTDLFHDGATLWEWVQLHEWEGIISKRMSSPYREGKQHQDWYKKKTAVQCEVDIVGLSLREGQVASLVMSLEGSFFGKVSLGLTVGLKRKLLEYVRAHPYPIPAGPFFPLPPDLRGNTLVWTSMPFSCQVTGLEVTSAGLLRHSKIVRLPTI